MGRRPFLTRATSALEEMRFDNPSLRLNELFQSVWTLGVRTEYHRKLRHGQLRSTRTQPLLKLLSVPGS
jgi:hypothetical protein